MANAANGTGCRAAGSLAAPESRVEPVPRPGYHGKYPRWIGHKFEIDGTVRRFPGHGVMCALPQQSAMRNALQHLHDDLPRQDFGSSLVLLPPSSWHMTVYEGVSDQIRRRDCWPDQLSLDCSLEECSELVAEKLRRFDLGSEPNLRMAVAGWETLKDGIALKVVGADASVEQHLRALRDRLANLLQLRHPGFDTYSFHVGIAYQLRLIDQQEKEAIVTYLQDVLHKLPPVFEVEAPAFAVYEDMFAFEHQFYLQRHSNDVEASQERLAKSG